MVFIKEMVLVTNSTSFFFSLDEKVTKYVLYGPRESQEDGFSFCNAVELYPWQTGRKRHRAW